MKCPYCDGRGEIVTKKEIKKSLHGDVLNLRKEGLTYREIGKVLNLAASRVHAIVKESEKK